MLYTITYLVLDDGCPLIWCIVQYCDYTVRCDFGARYVLRNKFLKR